MEKITGLHLIEPCVEYEKSFARMVEDYRAADEQVYYNKYAKAFPDFKRYVKRLHEESIRNDGWVPTRTYWLTDQHGEILGTSRLRTSLEHDYVRQFAGNIGYDVPPRFRRQSCGTALLRLTLDKARSVPLQQVLITCVNHNSGSRNIILKNGGQYESTIYDQEEQEHQERYWITLD